MSSNDAKEWIQKLKNKGIKTFENSELPVELKGSRAVIIKAKYADLIRKNRKSSHGMKWDII